MCVKTFQLKCHLMIHFRAAHRGVNEANAVLEDGEEPDKEATPSRERDNNWPIVEVLGKEVAAPAEPQMED